MPHDQRRPDGVHQEQPLQGSRIQVGPAAFGLHRALVQDAGGHHQTAQRQAGALQLGCDELGHGSHRAVICVIQRGRGAPADGQHGVALLAQAVGQCGADAAGAAEHDGQAWGVVSGVHGGRS